MTIFLRRFVSPSQAAILCAPVNEHMYNTADLQNPSHEHRFGNCATVGQLLHGFLCCRATAKGCMYKVVDQETGVYRT